MRERDTTGEPRVVAPAGNPVGTHGPFLLSRLSNRRVAGEPGSTIELPVLLLVDGDKVTADAKSLASAKVVAEKVEDLRGPKIVIQKYKNKTGYKKRQGFRAELTTVKITAINA